MNKIATRGPLGLKEPKQGKDPARLAAIHDLPCAICWNYGEPQNSPTQAHHTIHGRYGTRKSPDSMTISLCEGHHQGLVDTSKVALHREPDEWKRKYGSDVDWIHWTTERLNER